MQRIWNINEQARRNSWIRKRLHQQTRKQYSYTTKIKKIADYFNVSVDYLMTGNESDSEKYYLNNETAQVAQEIFENKELKALFDVQRDMEPDDLKALHNMALALKRKERGDIDDCGC